MFSFTTFLFYMFLPVVCFTKISPKIMSGRPGQSIGAGVVGPKVFQVQTGFDNSRIKTPAETSQESFILNNVIRYGLTEHLEVSAVINQNWDTTRSRLPLQNNALSNTHNSGLSDFQLGFRSVVISESHGIKPTLALQTRFRTKWVDQNFRQQSVAPVFILSMVHTLDSRFSLTHNFGFTTDETIQNNSSSIYFMTSSLSYSVNDRWGLFFEGYGNIKKDRGFYYFDAGGDYYINNNLKLDIAFGGGKNFGVRESFISLGFSWRTQHI